MFPSLAVTSRDSGEIGHVPDADGTLRLPLADAPAALAWPVDGVHGIRPVELAFAAPSEPARHLPAAALLARWRAGQAALDPLLLAVTRAVAAGVPLEQAAREVAPIEPAPGLRLVPLRTPTLPPATHTNAVLVGSREIVVVDPGASDRAEQERLEALLAERAARGDKVVAVLLTHHHPDHVDGAAPLARRFGAPLLAHPGTAERLPGLRIDRTLEQGERYESLLALHTPGHAPGHLCLLHESTSTLLGGDLVAGEGTIVVAPSDGGDMGDYLTSLRQMAALAPRLLVPAHGNATAAPVPLLERTLAHRQAREAKIAAALETLGLADAKHLLPIAYDDVAPEVWPLAALSLEAHLLHLERQGRVTRSGLSWRFVF